MKNVQCKQVDFEALHRNEVTQEIEGYEDKYTSLNQKSFDNRKLSAGSIGTAGSPNNSPMNDKRASLELSS